MSDATGNGAMTSRERVIATFRQQDVDHMPCMPNFRSSPVVDGYRWSDARGELEVLTQALGVDTRLRFGVTPSVHPDVTVEVSEVHPVGERYPLLRKEYQTPRGLLACVVRKTPDWPYGEDIPFRSGFTPSRFVQPWLETEEDVERFAYVWRPPDDDTVALVRRRWEKAVALREEFQVPVFGQYYTNGLSTVCYLFGFEHGPIMAMDAPGVIDRLMEIVNETALGILELELDLGVDSVCRNGWYESTDYWMPEHHERWVPEQFRKEVRIAHQGGATVEYQMGTGLVPIMDSLRSVPFDCLSCLEPVLGTEDYVEMVNALPEKSLWGGVSAWAHLGDGTPETVRQAVRDAVSLIGRHRLVLGAVPSIRDYWPWEMVTAMLDEWRNVRDG